MKNLLIKIIIRLTRKLWNREFKRIICNSYSSSRINSFQMHELAGDWDRRFYPENQKRK